MFQAKDFIMKALDQVIKAINHLQKISCSEFFDTVPRNYPILYFGDHYHFTFSKF